MPTGNYEVDLLDQSLVVLGIAVPEAGESLLLMCGLGGLLAGMRRRIV